MKISLISCFVSEVGVNIQSQILLEILESLINRLFFLETKFIAAIAGFSLVYLVYDLVLFL